MAENGPPSECGPCRHLELEGFKKASSIMAPSLNNAISKAFQRRDTAHHLCTHFEAILSFGFMLLARTHYLAQLNNGEETWNLPCKQLLDTHSLYFFVFLGCGDMQWTNLFKNSLLRAYYMWELLLYEVVGT